MIQYRCRAVAISSPLRMPAITAPPLAPPASRGRLVRDRPSKRTTPPERNMIARRRWFRYWAPQITQRGYVWTRRAKVQKAARARHRTASRATAGSRSAGSVAKTSEAARRATLSGRHTSGPTKPLAQRHGRIESMRTSWQKPRAWTRRRDLARAADGSKRRAGLSRAISMP
jgi:hypothetical protein